MSEFNITIENMEDVLKLLESSTNEEVRKHIPEFKLWVEEKRKLQAVEEPNKVNPVEVSVVMSTVKSAA